MSVFDCSKETNSDGSYTILTKISAKNSFGIEKEFIYKVTLSYNGGITTDIGNWTLIKMQSEEYKKDLCASAHCITFLFTFALSKHNIKEQS